jgi:hypothetical protein
MQTRQLLDAVSGGRDDYLEGFAERERGDLRIISEIVSFRRNFMTSIQTVRADEKALFEGAVSKFKG